MSKTRKIDVKGSEISIISIGEDDYISLTDIVKNQEGVDHVKNWMRNKNTVEFLGLWESLHNPNFKGVEFDTFMKEAGLNRFNLTPQKWINATCAIGIISKPGKLGGTYAHKDIAFEFGSWISPEFKLYLIKEFQRLKEQEQKLLNPEWDYRRFLSKVNYRLHTDAIKENLIPVYGNLSKEQTGYIYAHEAEMLNVVVFGTTSKQWRENNPKLTLEGHNIRDMASIPQLTVLSNLENLHSHLIKQGLSQDERFKILKDEAMSQLKSLMNYKYSYPIESPLKYEQTSTFDNNLKGLLNVPPEE